MSNEAKTYVGYIRDLAYLLRERTVEAQVEKEKSGSTFEEGREFGLRQALFEAMTEPVAPPPPTPVESGRT